MLTLSVGAASAATIVMQVGSPWMTVDGVTSEIDPGQGTLPIIVSERTFVPIRAIVENLGGTVGFTAADQKVTIQLQNTAVELWIGRAEARINGQATTLATIPFVNAANRTMLPLRFVIETLGGQVAWEGINQRITISYGGTTTGKTLPPGYPQADFPVINGGVVTTSQLHNDGDMTVVISSDRSPAAANEFYQGVMQSASDRKDEITGGSYYLKGKKNVWEAEITIASSPASVGSSQITIELERQ